jgi:hypothetical protein
VPTAARRLIVTPSYTFTATACAIEWAGARTAYVPSVVVAHTRERTSIEADPGVRLPAAPTPAELIADVRATDARWLLDVAPLHACLPTS